MDQCEQSALFLCMAILEGRWQLGGGNLAGDATNPTSSLTQYQVQNTFLPSTYEASGFANSLSLPKWSSRCENRGDALLTMSIGTVAVWWASFLLLGSTLTETRQFAGQTTLPTMWTQATTHSRGSPAR